jgi:polyhydroxyalkanoate synthesis regulator phasin
MTRKEKSDLIEELFKKGDPIDQALRKGVQDALRRHKQAGKPICEQRDGKIIWIQPEDIDLDEAK